MPKIVFLDVGGHVGQTLDEVLKDSYHFDTVHCFEPFPEACRTIKAKFSAHIASKKLILHQFGLSNADRSIDFFGDNTDGGASSYVGKNSSGHTEHVSQLTVRCVSEFFEQNLDGSEIVIMKLNCEGAECDILNELVQSGELRKVSNVMIDFDTFKIRGQRNLPFETLRKLKQFGFQDYYLAKDVMVGTTHQARIRNWLAFVNSKHSVFLQAAPRPSHPGWLHRNWWMARKRTMGFLDQMLQKQPQAD